MKSVLKALLNGHLAIAAVALAAQGCQDDGAGSGPDLSGRWAMFRFEDPVVVDIDQAGSAIQGQGCCGIFAGEHDISCCGPLTGQIVDRRASFGFSFDYGGEPHVYSTDAFVSSDGKRMAGTFSPWGGPMAWVRIGAYEAYLPPPSSALESVTSGHYTLVLSDNPGAGSDFSWQPTYVLFTDPRFVFGDLGAFWSGEMTWNADQQTLVVGPVPETAPGLPVAMSLRFDGAALASVEAVMASGARYQFQATPWQP
jgi:hypothetical protein